MGDARRQIAAMVFLGGICLMILLSRPLMGVGPAWPANGLVAITFVMIVIFGWRVWEALQRARQR